MTEEERINPNHRQTRSTLRMMGPVICGIGLILTIIGIGNFFASFGSFEPPRYFWCAFIGLPLMAVGGKLSLFGYMGAITRYQAGEMAPVGKDTFNYLADGTKGGVKTMASAVGAGLSEGMSGQSADCPSCGTSNDKDAKFCDECGTAMAKSCPSCGEANDGDAKFCNGCGNRF